MKKTCFFVIALVLLLLPSKFVSAAEAPNYKIKLTIIKNVVENNWTDASEIKIKLTDQDGIPFSGKYIRLKWEEGFLGWFEDTIPIDNKTDSHGIITFYHTGGEVGAVKLRVIVGSDNEDYFTSTYAEGISTDTTLTLTFVKDTTDYTKPKALFRAYGQKTIFFLDQKNVIHVCPTTTIFESYYGKKTLTIKNVPAAEIAKYQFGANVPYHENTLVRFASQPKKIYEVMNGSVFRWLQDENTVKYLYGDNWQKKVKILPETLFSDYAATYSVKAELHYSEPK